jgi:hypothetical protein
MNRKNGSEDAVDRDRRTWDESEAGDLESAGAAAPGDPDDGGGVAVEEDLDDIDAPIDHDFGLPEDWELEALDLDDHEDDDEDQGDGESDEDEAEMLLLHELGIDLDAPDLEAELDDLPFTLVQDDSTDDGVAA